MEKLIPDFYDETFLTLVAATIALILTGFFLSRSWVAGKVRLPPGPRGLPLLGSLLSMEEFPHRFFLKLSKKYGPLVYMHIGSKPALVVCSRDMAKENFQANDQVLAPRPALLLPAILFYNDLSVAFAPYGAHWRNARKICNTHLFTPSRLSQFSGLIEGEVKATVSLVLQGSESGKAVNVTNLFSAMAINNVTQMMWGKRHRDISKSTEDGEMDKFHELFSSVMELFAANNLADFLPLFASPIMKLSGLERKAKDVHNEIDKFLEQVLCEREEQQSTKSKSATDGDDLVDVLLKLANESTDDSEQLSRIAIKAILMDMVVDGTDTTGTTMDWAFAELMRHPDVVSKAQDELNTVVGTDRLVTTADIPNLKYIGALVKETLRRRGLPLTAPRLSLADCKVGGYDVPANTLVFTLLYAIHHDPARWDKPMEFNPDRFLGSEVDFKGRHFDLLPFGFGRRKCLGMNLAVSSLHLGLAQLLHCIDWSLPEGQTPESIDMTENAGIVLPRAKPLFLFGKPRLSPDIISSTFCLA